MSREPRDQHWPSDVGLRDPFGGDEVLPWLGHRSSDAVSFADEAELFRAFRAWWEGRSEAPPRALAERLGLAAPCLSDQNQPAMRPEGVDVVRVLVAAATNYTPDAGMVAPDRMLGPWVDQADLRQPLVRRAVLHAVASSALWPPALRRPPDAHRWARDKRRPDPAIRDAVHAVRRAPPGLWRLVEQRGDAWVVEDLIGLATWWTPQQPVRLDEVGGVAGPPRAGGLLAARMVPTAAGWQAALAVVLPEAPTCEQVWAWWEPRLWLMRARWPELSLEESLRQQGQALVRAAHELVWRRHV